MKEGGTGGSNTRTGLNFENRVDLLTLVRGLPDYEVKKSSKAGQEITFRGSVVARCFRKHDFYKFLEEEQVDWKNKISKNYYLTMRCQ